MGEVYRARDSKLGRDVAIKVLPPALSADHEYLARFKREAQVLASLNHPHIAAIYGLEEGAIVMELVDGQTLAERIGAGAPAIDEVLEIAKQMAEALDAAHERGVIHRDLKPSNVKITSSGSVKLLDFGLAKSVQGHAVDPEESPTQTVGVSKTGVILGTAAYMSPEQARGLPVDRRTDIWAFGAVLYEMLTGRRAFGGETVTDILAAVLKSEPDYSLFPESLPPRIAYLVKRCLRKKPAERLRDIGEARIWIEEADDEAPAVAPRATAPMGRDTGRARRGRSIGSGPLAGSLTSRNTHLERHFPGRAESGSRAENLPRRQDAGIPNHGGWVAASGGDETGERKLDRAHAGAGAGGGSGDCLVAGWNQAVL